jgi:rod shape-determining protein MreC
VTYRRLLVIRLVALWALLELFAAWQVRTPDGSLLLASWLRAVARPVIVVADATLATAQALVVGVGDYGRLVADNRRMRIELEGLTARHRLLQEDLRALRDASLLSGPSSEYAAGAMVARCAFRDVAGGTMEVRTAEQMVVPRDSPVVTRDGVVGRITRSEGRRHWIQLITHAAAAVAVRTDDGRLEGLALGSGSEALSIAYVPRQANLERGTVLITSGGDGIFPPGIPAAWVVGVRETAGPFLEVAAATTASLPTTRVVLILPQWSTRQDGP